MCTFIRHLQVDVEEQTFILLNGECLPDELFEVHYCLFGIAPPPELSLLYFLMALVLLGWWKLSTTSILPDFLSCSIILFLSMISANRLIDSFGPSFYILV